jgi:hypothetical protein
MEKQRTVVEKVAKMKELGIFDKWVANTDKRTKECEIYVRNVQRRNELLIKYKYLSNMIESSFLFADTQEKQDFWNNIVDELRSEI